MNEMVNLRRLLLMSVPRSSGRGRKHENAPLVTILAAALAWAVFAVPSAEAQPSVSLEPAGSYDAPLLLEPICLNSYTAYVLIFRRAADAAVASAEVHATTVAPNSSVRGPTLAEVILPLDDRPNAFRGVYADSNMGWDVFTTEQGTLTAPGTPDGQWCGALDVIGGTATLYRVSVR